MSGEYVFENERQSKTFLSENGDKRLLCVTELPTGLPTSLEKICKQCIAHAENYCKSEILASVPESGFFAYKLYLRAYSEDKKIILCATATLSDRVSCRVLYKKEHKFKYRAPGFFCNPTAALGI